MTSFVLKIIAIISMFLDHLSYSIYGQFSWLNYLGRLSFPIFAFQITEGYHHTKNLKKYFLRLGIFAVISQIPFYLFTNTFTTEFTLNIFFTLFAGLLAIIGTVAATVGTQACWLLLADESEMPRSLIEK